MQLHEVIAGIKANAHAKVLIVGVRGDNFPPRYHTHPQLVFWETDQAATTPIPQAVRLICPTRFINHGLWSRLQNEATRRGILLVHLQGTGEIKALLEPLIPQREEVKVVLDIETPAAIPDNVPNVQHVSTARPHAHAGVLHAWVEQRVDRALLLTHVEGTRMGVMTKESQRLATWAKAEGLTTTTPSSIAQVLRRIRRDLLAKAKREEVNRRRSETQKANFAVKVATVPTPNTAAIESIADDDRELLLMAQDAIAALELIKGKLEDRAQKKARLFAALKDL